MLSLNGGFRQDLLYWDNHFQSAARKWFSLFLYWYRLSPDPARWDVWKAATVFVIALNQKYTICAGFVKSLHTESLLNLVLVYIPLSCLNTVLQNSRNFPALITTALSKNSISELKLISFRFVSLFTLWHYMAVLRVLRTAYSWLRGKYHISLLIYPVPFSNVWLFQPFLASKPRTYRKCSLYMDMFCHHTQKTR